MRRRGFVTGIGLTALGAAGLGLGPASTAYALPGRHRGSRPAAGTGALLQGEWQRVGAPEGTPAALLNDVAASGPGSAWAVGEDNIPGGIPRGRPLALRWDGAAWARTDVSHLGIGGALVAVAAGPDGRAWALADDGAATSPVTRLLAWDGSRDGGTWREVPYPGRGEAGTALNAVAVGPDGRVWVAGSKGGRAGLMCGDGSAWHWVKPVPDEASPVPYGVHIASSGDIWISGPVIARWDGRDWTVLPPVQAIRLTVTDLLPSAPDDVWVTGAAFGVGGPPDKPPGIVLQRWNGTEWTSWRDRAPFTVGALTSICADARGRPALISGWDFWDQSRSHYLRWDAAAEAWTSQRGPATPEIKPLMNNVTAIPGTDGFWSVGTTSRYAYPPAQLHVERYA
ncbi:hypothetical protein ACWGJ2_03905 [Streptomyces sp. NPDC054796]